MNSEKAIQFLKRHGMEPERIHPSEAAVKMIEEMERGLAGQASSFPMIPTYLSDVGEIPLHEPVAVIDAGGTNFRRALVTFHEGGYDVEELAKWKMPGIDAPATWEAFISFAADCMEPLMERTDRIGFCFSYSADITPEIDGRVRSIDKEVVITGCEGRLVGQSLVDELARRGYPGKRVAVLNDTVAVLLGGLAGKGAACPIGQVSGTGSNTCCSLPEKRIGKIGRRTDRRMIVNLESGMYDGLPRGDFDIELDAESHNPGQKFFEKMTAGVYIGELVHRMLRCAAQEGELSPATAEKIAALGWIDSAVIDAWAAGEKLASVCSGGEDAAFVQSLSCSVFDRSARCMCANLIAIALLCAQKEARICAEGSLVQRSRAYRPALEKYLAEVGAELGVHALLALGNETTLPGSAAAALLNI